MVDLYIFISIVSATVVSQNHKLVIIAGDPRVVDIEVNMECVISSVQTIYGPVVV